MSKSWIPWIWHIILRYDSKNMNNKRKKWNFIKIKSFCASKDVKKVKKHTTKRIWADISTKINKWNYAHEKCSKSLVTREMQIKTTRHHFTPIRIATIKTKKENKYWQELVAGAAAPGALPLQMRTVPRCGRQCGGFSEC